MAGEDSLRDFVIDAGRRLNRPPEEVEPYTKILMDNWFDSPESLADTKPEELANQGIPLRFAKELVTAAARGPRSGRRGPGKGKGKGEGKDSEKGRSPALRREEEWKEPAGRAGGGEFKQRLDLWEHDRGFNLRGAIIGERGRNVHHIQDQTGARLWVQGGDGGEPLCVNISAPSAKDLSRAVRLAKDLIGAVRAEYEQWLRHDRDRRGQDQSAEAKGKRQEKGKAKAKGKGKEPREARWRGSSGKGGKDGEWKEVMDLWDCEPGFNIKGKIIGDGGRNVHHIQDQTGAKLWLAGDPVKLEVSADSADNLDRAVQMASDLLGAVHDEYTEWLENDMNENRGQARDRGKGKGKDKGKDAGKGRRREGGKGNEGDYVKVLKVRDLDAGFRPRGAIIGDQGRNIHHIQDQTGAKLWLEGEIATGMRLEIRAGSSEDLNSAVQMAKDLLSTVYQTYDDWLQEGGNDRDGQNRARRRDHREDEPPPKRARSS